MCGRYTATHQDKLVAAMELELGLTQPDAPGLTRPDAPGLTRPDAPGLTRPDAVLATAPRMPEGLRSWWEPRWNIAPTQPAPVAVQRAHAPRGQLCLMRWGLVPHWADSLAVGVKHINARAETVAGKRPFAEALRRRRCLVAADGFYEWQKDGKRRIPFLFAPTDGEPVTFAGLWDRWRPPGSPSGTPWVESFTILTTAADALVTPLHDRMPLVIRPEDRARWMSPDEVPPEALADLLRPTRLTGWERHEVDPWVNASGRERGSVRTE